MTKGSWPTLSGLMALHSGVNRVLWSREEKALVLSNNLGVDFLEMVRLCLGLDRDIEYHQDKNNETL